MTESRQMSGVERLWLAADGIAPPFANQMVIEGCPCPPAPVERWREALATVVPSWPGCRVRRIGVLWAARWQADGHPPAVVEVDGASWDGLSPAGAPFLRRPLDARHGPCCEVLLARCERTPRLVLRTHHAVMDGEGTLMLAGALFAAMRGDAIRAVPLGPPDEAVAGGMGQGRERPPPRDCLPPFRGVSGGAGAGVTWGRRSVAGPQRRPLGALAVAVAQAAGGACRVDVPVDLRRNRPGVEGCGNLTGLVRLPVDPARDPATVEDDLRSRIERGEAAAFVLGAARVRGVPLAAMVRAGRQAARDSLSLGRYETTATLSNLGRLDPADFSCPGFEARRCFFVPPGSAGLPLFLAVTGGPEGLELCASAPAALASGGRLGGLLDALAFALGQGSVRAGRG